jgi:mono/diheme cytochrome c family protein
MYNMKEKYAKLTQGAANPYIDPAGYKTELDIDEAMFHAVLQDQQKTSGPTTSAAPPASPAAGPAADSLVAQGKTRFKAYGCVDCHGANGEGTDMGPNLTGIHLDGDGISKFLQKPSSDARLAGMPNLAADSPDLPALVAYVLSIKRSAP